MSNRRRSYVFILTLFIAGCAAAQDYPRCYLFRQPTAEDIDSTNRDTAEFLTKVMHISDFGLSKDIVTVKSTRWTQSRLKSVWPEIGCVNLRREPPRQAEMEDKWAVAQCQDYLEEMLARANDNAPVPRTEIATKFDELACH